MQKTFWYVIGGVLLVVLLGLAYYTISPLFVRVAIDEAVPAEEAAGAPNEGVVVESERVAVVDTPIHPASGFVRIVEADGKRYIRYEEYKTINGPDLYVYLAKDIDAKEFVDLGRIKATEGNINYEIPAEVDIAEYPYVLTWCKAFGVLFNSANLSSAR